jgi:hypothetical protein
MRVYHLTEAQQLAAAALKFERDLAAVTSTIPASASSWPSRSTRPRSQARESGPAVERGERHHGQIAGRDEERFLRRRLAQSDRRRPEKAALIDRAFASATLTWRFRLAMERNPTDAAHASPLNPPGTPARAFASIWSTARRGPRATCSVRRSPGIPATQNFSTWERCPMRAGATQQAHALLDRALAGDRCRSNCPTS